MIDKEIIGEEVVLTAVQALRALTKELFGESTSKKPLLEDETTVPIYLQVQLKKIPKLENLKRIKVKLPHSLVKEDASVCLITGDLDKNNRKAEIEPDKRHYEELLNKHGITNISDVITLRELRTEYKPYEAKQKLLGAYDVFLADSKILECLPKLLGKHFYRKRKFPIRIDMKSPNLKDQISSALASKMFNLTGHGNSCTSEVAYLNMEDKDIFGNVTSMVKALSEQLPGSIDNVMGMYLKTSKTKAIPVYISYGSPNDISLEDEKKNKDFEVDEVTTIPNAYVKIFRDGRVTTLKNSSVEVSKKNQSAKNEIDKSAAESGLNEESIKKSKKFINKRKRAESESEERQSNKKQVKTTKKMFKDVNIKKSIRSDLNDATVKKSKKFIKEGKRARSKPEEHQHIKQQVQTTKKIMFKDANMKKSTKSGLNEETVKKSKKFINKRKRVGSESEERQSNKEQVETAKKMFKAVNIKKSISLKKKGNSQRRM